jgi:anti-sigma regulatory factor (Ser/Thr protein kinase)
MGMTGSHGESPAGAVAGLAATAPRAPEDPPVSVVRVARIFPGRKDQVALAREFVRRVLGPVPVLDEAVLLVSELCTNALQHTASGRGGAFEVAVLQWPGSLRIEVRDQGSGRAPALHPIDVLAEDGRGLGLIELLADAWGHDGDRHGRTVFFELSWANPRS